MSKHGKKFMPVNLGGADRLIRFLLGDFIIVLTWYWLPQDLLAICLYAVSIILILTALTGRCLIYYAFGINTAKFKGISETMMLLIFFYALLVPVITILLRKYLE